MNPGDFVEPVIALARQAGNAILDVYGTDFAVDEKEDDSPLTRADLASHAIIAAGLETLSPDIPVLSEESGLPEFDVRRRWTRYWLVDPLDGTREFVKRNGEFTVNIALIDKHRPALGVVHVPVTGKTYVGWVGGEATVRSHSSAERIHVAERSSEPVRIVGSRSHRGTSLDRLIEKLGDIQLVPMGSSLKFCVVAEGGADIYPRLGPTSEWDTAAAQAVVEAAGGAVLQLDGSPLAYNRKDDILNPHFLVRGPDDRDWLALLAAVT